MALCKYVCIPLKTCLIRPSSLVSNAASDDDNDDDDDDKEEGEVVADAVKGNRSQSTRAKTSYVSLSPEPRTSTSKSTSAISAAAAAAAFCFSCCFSV